MTRRLADHGRACARLALLVCWSAWLAPRLVGRGDPTRLLSEWAAGACRILGVTIARTGPLPPPHALIVANHLGYLDIVTLAAIAEMTFVAKSEIASWPVVGAAARRAGTIFIDRRRLRDIVRVMCLLRHELDRGRRVVLFPEATSTDGRQVLPFKSGLLQVAVERDQPIWAAALALVPASEHVNARDVLCWHGDRAFVPHLYQFLKVRRCTMRVRFHDRAIYRSNRKLLAVVARDTVLEDLAGRLA